MFTDVYRRVANGTIVWSLFDSQIFRVDPSPFGQFSMDWFKGKTAGKQAFQCKKNGCPGSFALNQSIDLIPCNKLPREMWQTAKTCIILVVLKTHDWRNHSVLGVPNCQTST